MTGNAGLQTLARRLSMVEQEEFLGVVVAGSPQFSRAHHASLYVAVGAEFPLVVAITARAFAAVCRSRMTRQKSGRVIAGCRVGRFGAMTREALGAGVARAAALGTSRGGLRVAGREIRAVRGG